MEKTINGKVVFDGANAAPTKFVADVEYPNELPQYGIDNAGMHLVVSADGKSTEWSEVPAAELPAFVVGDAGKHLAIKADGSGLEWVVPFSLPALPEDAAEKTYALQAVNGVLTWVEVIA